MIKTKGVITKTTVNVDDIDPEFQIQHELIKLPHDLMIGEMAMRKRGEEYIEKDFKEDDKEYKARLNRACLYHGFEDVVEYAVGQVFQKNITVEEVSEEILEWSNDVDNQGNNFTKWSNDAFQSVLVDGMCYALVEYSAVETVQDEQGNLLYRDGEEWRPKTAEADKSNGWRPYLIQIPTQNILGIRTRTVNGREVVTMLRYKEIDDIEDGTDFGRDKIERIRVYREGGYWEVHEKKGEETNFTKESSGRLSIGEIPLVMCQLGKKITSYTAYPTLQKVADLNKHYWQRSGSYHGSLLQFNDKPPYLASGISTGMPYTQNQSTGEYEQQELHLCAGMFIQTNQVGSDLKSVGVDANSVINSRQSLIDLESQMKGYKSKLLESPHVEKTATESKIESNESNSKLKSWAVTFEDFLNHTMYYLGLWLEQDLSQMKVEVNKEFSTPRDKAFLFSLRRSGDISQELFLREMVAIGELPEDMDVEEEIQRNKNEQRLLSTPTNPTAKSLTDRLNNA